MRAPLTRTGPCLQLGLFQGFNTESLSCPSLSSPTFETSVRSVLLRITTRRIKAAKQNLQSSFQDSRWEGLEFYKAGARKHNITCSQSSLRLPAPSALPTSFFLRSSQQMLFSRDRFSHVVDEKKKQKQNRGSDRNGGFEDLCPNVCQVSSEHPKGSEVLG